MQTSERTAIWVAFIGVLALALIVFFVVRAGRLPSRSGTESPSGIPRESAQPTVLDDRTTWPMFGGGPGLLGRASTTLGDSLAFLWRFKTNAEVKSSAAIYEGRVFIGSSDGHVYAINLQDGTKLWSYATEDAVEAAPCVVEGRVYVGSSDNCLYALDAATGDLEWKYETEGEILGAANWTRSPDGQVLWVLVGSYDNRVHCVNGATGKAVWTYETQNYVNGSPALGDGKCAFGGCDAFIHVISVADGTKLTEIDGGSYIAASGAFAEGQVYIGNYDNVFIRADATKGEIVWRYTESDAPFFSSPAVTDDLVIVGGRDALVHALRRDNGDRVWTFKTLGEVDSSPAVCGDKVIVGSSDGRLYMLRLADGTEVWSYEIGQPIISSPAVAQGTVVVGCDDGYVYAFGSVGGTPAQ
ncbi:MAG: PQQ-binding-like beta-propeller repeat protein [Sedimentisphaerales bacterium]|nr:PQQ-binding-like beta-propeller repeat protein [Sedimentisphaerales bacterium]